MEKTITINLGLMETIPLGQGRPFIVGGEEIAVFRCRDGAIAAIENTCPHLQGVLSDGLIGNGKVLCPLHGHKFDLKTGKGSEENECVRVFEASVENGAIVIQYYPVPAETISA